MKLMSMIDLVIVESGTATNTAQLKTKNYVTYTSITFIKVLRKCELTK